MPQWSRRFENVCPQTIAMRAVSVTLFYSILHYWQWLYIILLYSTILTETSFTLLYITDFFLRIVPPDKHHACNGSDFGGIVLTAGQGSWQNKYTVHTRYTHDKHMVNTRWIHDKGGENLLKKRRSTARIRRNKNLNLSLSLKLS